MVYKNSKNSKKKINDLKPVIKTSYKKVNRKQNTKQIGGGAWGEFKEWSQKTVGRYKGKGVKVDGKIEFFSRQKRGLSQFKIGQNYRSGEQIKNRVNYVTKRIEEKKHQFTKVNNKLSGKQFKFDRIVDNKFKKVEIEIATEQANLSKKLAQGKITKEQFNSGVDKLAKRKDNIVKELEVEKKNFLEKHAKLIKKMEKKRKEFIKISDKYKPKIEKLTLKLETKIRKANKLLDKGLYRTCKKSPNEACFDTLKACRKDTSNISKLQLLNCMKGIEGFTSENLNANISKIKWYNSPSRRRKIRARSKRIEGLPQTQKIQNDYRKIQNEVSKIKQTRVSNTPAINQILDKERLKKYKKSEAQEFADKEVSKLKTGMDQSITQKKGEFNKTISQTISDTQKVQEAEKKAAKNAVEKLEAKELAAAEAKAAAEEAAKKAAKEAEEAAAQTLATEAEEAAAQKLAKEAEEAAAEAAAQKAAKARKITLEPPNKHPFLPTSYTEGSSYV